MSIFNLVTDNNRNWAVIWNENEIKTAKMKNQLWDTVFKNTKAFEIGLWIKLHDGEYDILWIDRKMSHLKENHYGEYIQDMYIIEGVSFKKYNDAVKFHDYLEKEYVWQLLKC